MNALVYHDSCFEPRRCVTACVLTICQRSKISIAELAAAENVDVYSGLYGSIFSAVEILGQINESAFDFFPLLPKTRSSTVAQRPRGH